MALQQLSLQFPILYPIATSPKPSSSSSSSSYPQIKLTPKPIIKHSPITRTTKRKITQFAIKATNTEEEEEENLQAANNNDEDSSEPQTVTNEPQPQPTDSSATGDLSELGSEIKKAMKEREGRDGGGDWWSGVAEEIREIEWPAFGKVVGITGVVLGVIAGSSVVLLTVNAVLAELSDRVFAGKGVQDFFG